MRIVDSTLFEVIGDTLHKLYSDGYHHVKLMCPKNRFPQNFIQNSLIVGCNIGFSNDEKIPNSKGVVAVHYCVTEKFLERELTYERTGSKYMEESGRTLENIFKNTVNTAEKSREIKNRILKTTNKTTSKELDDLEKNKLLFKDKFQSKSTQLSINSSFTNKFIAIDPRFILPVRNARKKYFDNQTFIINPNGEGSFKLQVENEDLTDEKYMELGENHLIPLYRYIKYINNTHRWMVLQLQSDDYKKYNFPSKEHFLRSRIAGLVNTAEIDEYNNLLEFFASTAIANYPIPEILKLSTDYLATDLFSYFLLQSDPFITTDFPVNVHITGIGTGKVSIVLGFTVTITDLLGDDLEAVDFEPGIGVLSIVMAFENISVSPFESSSETSPIKYLYTEKLPDHTFTTVLDTSSSLVDTEVKSPDNSVDIQFSIKADEENSSEKIQTGKNIELKLFVIGIVLFVILVILLYVKG